MRVLITVLRTVVLFVAGATIQLGSPIVGFVGGGFLGSIVATKLMPLPEGECGTGIVVPLILGWLVGCILGLMLGVALGAVLTSLLFGLTNLSNDFGDDEFY